MDISVIEFIEKMSIIFLPKFLLLLIFIFLFFSNKKLKISIKEPQKIDKFLFISSFILFILFIIALEYSFVKYVLIVIISFYLFSNYKKVFLKFDYFLILTFIIMFIDFGLLSNIEFIQKIFTNIDMNFFNTLNISIILSQFISNVPTAIFISHFSNNYTALAYGVDIGGNGLLISSLANIIALRALKNKIAYIEFHKYSIPFLFISYIIIILLFYILNK